MKENVKTEYKPRRSHVFWMGVPEKKGKKKKKGVKEVPKKFRKRNVWPN